MLIAELVTSSPKRLTSGARELGEANHSLKFGSGATEKTYVLSFEDSQSATVQIASTTPGEARRTVTCEFHGLQGKRLALVSFEPIKVSTPISVNYNDAMFLGEIVGCFPESAMTWQLEVKVEQILSGLQSLLSLRNSLLDEAVAKPLTLMPKGARN